VNVMRTQWRLAARRAKAATWGHYPICSVVQGVNPRLRKFLTAPLSTETKPDASEDEEFSFLDRNNPPQLTEEMVSRLSEEGWKRVKPVYPDDFKNMIDNVTMKGTPDYNQLEDLASAFTRDEPVPYYVENSGPKGNINVKNPCLLCDHFQVKMCDHVKKVEYTNLVLLNKFVNERGMINSSRVNGTCAKAQRKIARLIRRARTVGIMSYLEKWSPPIEFMKKMKWFETDTQMEEREFYSKRKGRKV